MLNIARNVYAAWDTTNQKNKELNEVEIIPIGSSANEKNKLKNLSKKFTDFIELENIPLPGFTLFSVGRKNYGSNESWLVIDPRGFLVRLSSANLETILHVTGITEGLIQEKCIWARDNTETKMILVPVSSDKYIEAVKNTELIEGKVDIKTVQIGDTVLLQNKLQGTYLGVMSLYGPLQDYATSNIYKPQSFLRRGVIEVGSGKFHYQVSPKILKVLTKTDSPMSREDAVEHVNAQNCSNCYFFSHNDVSGHQFGSRGAIKIASTNAVPNILMSFVEIDNFEATGLFYDGQANYDFGMLLLEDDNSKRYLVDYPYSFSFGSGRKSAMSINNFNTCEVDLPLLEPTSSIELFETRKSVFNGVSESSPGALDKFAKFYKIVKHVKNETYV